MAYYNVPVESKTVKFDQYHCTPQRQHFHTSSNAESNNLQVQGYSHNHLTAQRGVPNVISWPYYPAGVTGEPDSYISTLVLVPESLPSCIETVLGSKQSSTPLDTCPQQAKRPSSTPFYGSTSKQTILQRKFLHSVSIMTPLLIIRTAYTAC